VLVDSWYDSYLGVIVLVRTDGKLRRAKVNSSRTAHDHKSGALSSAKWKTSTNSAPAKSVFLTASIKQVHGCRVGDTITHQKSEYFGFKPAARCFFCGYFPSVRAV
jgi:GTP-binding protein LepA